MVAMRKKNDKFALMPIKLTSYYKGKDIPDDLPGEDIFHSKDLFLLYEKASGYTPLLIVASSEGRPVARLLAAIRKQSFFIPTRLGKRCEVYGTGECLADDVDKELVFGEMLEHLTQETLRHAHIIEFRNLSNSLNGYKYFRLNKYFSINWLRVRNSLHSVESVEEGFNPSRLRQVKCGLKSGATVSVATDAREIEEFSSMLHKIYSSRIRKYFPGLQFFKLADECLISKDLARIHVVKCKEKIIGGAVSLYSKNSAYLWFSGGMTKTYLKQYPGVLAVWAALKDAKARGCRHMEFMDVGLPFQKHGYRTFVLHFGGRQSSTRRWFRMRNNLLNYLLRKLYA